MFCDKNTCGMRVAISVNFAVGATAIIHLSHESQYRYEDEILPKRWNRYIWKTPKNTEKCMGVSL